MTPSRTIELLTVGLASATGLVVLLTVRENELKREYFALRAKAALPYRGYAVPTFRTTTLAGDTMTVGEVADSGGKQLVFVLTTTCPFCQATLPVWAALADSVGRLVGKPTQVVALSLDSIPATARYVARHGLRYPVGRFPDWKVAQLFRARSVPQTLVLDHRGEVVFAHIGQLRPGPVLDSVYRAVRSEWTAREAAPAAGPRLASGTGRR